VVVAAKEAKAKIGSEIEMKVEVSKRSKNQRWAVSGKQNFNSIQLLIEGKVARLH